VDAHRIFSFIDAVEGFETLVGEKDAFGETASRRARVAQIMQTAAETRMRAALMISC
jgi:hypothetical protein